LRTCEAITKMNELFLPILPTFWLPHVWPCKGRTTWLPFCRWLRIETSFRNVLRSRGREFYSTGIQRLTQHWQKCVENDGDITQKLSYNCKTYMNHPSKFYCYCNYIFWEKIGDITFVPLLVFLSEKEHILLSCRLKSVKITNQAVWRQWRNTYQ
jgi:hypothetical protein